jgi:hypothetical protein
VFQQTIAAHTRRTTHGTARTADTDIAAAMARTILITVLIKMMQTITRECVTTSRTVLPIVRTRAITTLATTDRTVHTTARTEAVMTVTTTTITKKHVTTKHMLQAIVRTRAITMQPVITRRTVHLTARTTATAATSRKYVTTRRTIRAIVTTAAITMAAVTTDRTAPLIVRTMAVKVERMMMPMIKKYTYAMYLREIQVCALL